MSTTTVIDTEHDTDAAAVAAAISDLGPLDREALVLRLRGRTLDEVATATRTTTAMVRVRLHRAATDIERRVGQFPVDGTQLHPDHGLPIAEVVTDAEVGITPLLRARLVAALHHLRGPSHPRFRRAAALRQSLTEHAPRLSSVAGVLALASVAVAALTSAS